MIFKPKEIILLCEECRSLLSWKDITPDGKCGHVCRMKKYRQEHRCESFIEEYTRTK